MLRIIHRNSNRVPIYEQSPYRPKTTKLVSQQLRRAIYLDPSVLATTSTLIPAKLANPSHNSRVPRVHPPSRATTQEMLFRAHPKSLGSTPQATRRHTSSVTTTGFWHFEASSKEPQTLYIQSITWNYIVFVSDFFFIHNFLFVFWSNIISISSFWKGFIFVVKKWDKQPINPPILLCQGMWF